MRQPIDPFTVADCPKAIRFREVAHHIETPPGSDNWVTTYVPVKATYCWLFSVDPHGSVGRRYINANNSPFEPIEDDETATIGYLCKLNPWTGEVKYADSISLFPVTEARLEAWQDAGILVDPSGG